MNTLFEHEVQPFPTGYKEIQQRVSRIKPVKYGKTRNYINGAVTYLSPYISRGVISTKQLLHQVLDQGYPPQQIEKFIQELAWRDYWQQIWIAKGDAINTELKNKQTQVSHFQIPTAILEAKTGVQAIDTAITGLYENGYVHNHARMYIAAICCNVAQGYWKLPAQWMYYHLLDADWASNTLSWQWVAGANSHKKYYANQENINTYCFTHQRNTFLDVPYTSFKSLPIPTTLKATSSVSLEAKLPTAKPIELDKNIPTCIYNIYNLDPLWKKDVDVNRVLLLEPSHFKHYPVSEKTIDFVLALAENIKNIQLFVGEFDDLAKMVTGMLHYKEHPFTKHYRGIEDARDWMFTIQGYYPSFFAFWKKCKKELTANYPTLNNEE